MTDTVLVVDNNRDVVDVVATFFSLRGFTVLKALNGTEALTLAQTERPAVIICDVLMEPMNGFEVLQQIRNTPELANTILIMASAKAYRSDIDRARQLGANDYVVKPFLMEDLLQGGAAPPGAPVAPDHDGHLLGGARLHRDSGPGHDPVTVATPRAWSCGAVATSSSSTPARGSGSSGRRCSRSSRAAR